MKDKLLKTFDSLLNEFDFEMVHKCMKAMDWQWAVIGCVPTIKHMKKHVQELFNSLILECFCENLERCSLSSGGFSLTVNKTNDDITLDLEFIIEDHSISVSEIED